MHNDSLFGRFLVYRALLRRLLLSLLLLLLAAGCNSPDEESAVPDTAGDVQPLPVPATPGQVGPPVASARQVVIWAPEFMLPGDETPAQRAMGDAITVFRQRHEEVEVEVLPKAVSGPAATLPYLRSARQAAPAILPDLILIRGVELWQVADLGVIEPLDAASVEQLGDFYPFTLAAATYDGQLYGIPYAVELVHLAARLDRSVPGQWDALLAGDERYLIQGRATESNLNASLLTHFLAAGGELTESASLSEEVLTRLLSFYAAGRSTGVIAEESSTLADLDSVWRAFSTGAGTVTDVRSGLLLSERDALAWVAAFPPFADGDVSTTLADVWVFAVLTEDQVGRSDAVAFVETLMNADLHGQWAEHASLLPSTRSATAVWGETQPYYEFLKNLLGSDVAVVPGGRAFQEFAVRLQAAQEDVLTGEKGVEEAVAELMLAP